MTGRLTIIADDLTGACDTGAVFTAAGAVPVAVWPARPPAAAVRVIDTETRGGLPADAAARVRKAARHGGGAWFKKIDSTMRGPIGAEIAALMEATGAASAVVCPAFPAQGRVVTDRVLYVDGAPVAETVVAHDPAFPAAAGTSNVVDLLRRQLDRPLAWIPLDQVRTGRDALSARLARIAGTVAVADAETDADLDTLAAAAAAQPRPPLLAGAAGLARAVAAQGGWLGARVEIPPARRWLVVAGSRHPATRAQIAAARVAGLDVVASEAGPATDAAAIVAQLAEHARARIEADRVEALVVTGGETAAALCAALGVGIVWIEGAPVEGLALGRITGPRRRRIVLVTKAGGFGAPDLLVSLVKEAVA